LYITNNYNIIIPNEEISGRQMRDFNVEIRLLRNCATV